MLEVKTKETRTKESRTQAQVFSKKKGLQIFVSGEKGLKIFFSGNIRSRKTKKGFCKFSARSLAFSKKISTVQKIMLTSSRGQGNF